MALCNGCLASVIADTGAGVSMVTLHLAKKAGLVIRPVPAGMKQTLVAAGGEKYSTVGVTDITLYFELQLAVDGTDSMMNWSRCITIRNIRVTDLGDNAPRDIYLAYADWAPHSRAGIRSPLASLAELILGGAEVVNSPRAPAPGKPYEKVYLMRGDEVEPEADPDVPIASLVSGVEGGSEPSLRDRILGRIPEEKRGTPEAAQLADVLASRPEVFGPIDPAKCTTTIDFTLVSEPLPESRARPTSRKAHQAGPAAVAPLQDWIDRGLAERVSSDTPAYGNAVVVAKAGGKFRVVFDSPSINDSTVRVSTDGVMPDSMIREAMRVHGMKYAVKLDFSEAFVTLLLGPTARRVSVFHSILGKVRCKHGWFGWHSFPAVFQQLVKEKVIGPVLDAMGEDKARLVKLPAWIDDIVVAAASFVLLLEAVSLLVDAMLRIGARLSLGKCELLVDTFDWCGVEIDLRTNQWRIARRRVQDLLDLELPDNRDKLKNVLGTLRYYTFGVSNQRRFRECVAVLADLDYDGSRVKPHWTDEHTARMREALGMVAEGDWVLVYDPRRPVHVTTDASGEYGYSVTSHQYNDAGELRPISFYSKGWDGPQILWTAQTKEMYAQWRAVTKVMPKDFPYAQVVLHVDNMNIASHAVSTDPRIRRWAFDVQCAGATVCNWRPGHYNQIADYASRAPRPDFTKQLTDEERFELHIYAIEATPERRSARLAGANNMTAPAGAAMAALSAEGKGEGVKPKAKANGKTTAAVGSPPNAAQDATTGQRPVPVAPTAVQPVRKSAPPAAKADGGAKAAVGSPPDAVRDATTGQRPEPVAPPAAQPTPTATEAPTGPGTATEGPTGPGIATTADEGDDGALPDDTVVPGHVSIAPGLARILEAQSLFETDELTAWQTRGGYSEVLVTDGTLRLSNGRSIIPIRAVSLQTELLRAAHEGAHHLLGAERTTEALRRQFRVTWTGMDKDVKKYVQECFKCTFAKAAHSPRPVGTLTPTLPPSFHHTWYADFKGPMPNGSGYILVVREALSRVVKLRFVPAANAKELIEEFEEVYLSFGTYPRVLRSDNGQPFASSEFGEYCKTRGIVQAFGVPDHHQGQGFVETIIRPISNSLVAILGNKAQDEWANPPYLARLEAVINTSPVESIGGSPWWALYGLEPRTALSHQHSWQEALDAPDLDDNDVLELIAEHHAYIDSVQQRVSIASSLAQAITKRSYDASHRPPDFKVGQSVLLWKMPYNRLMPYFDGPYEIVKVSTDRNFVKLRFLLKHGATTAGPFHVSRLLHIDLSRADLDEIALHRLTTGNGVVREVLAHRFTEQGGHEFHVSWVNTDLKTWLPFRGNERLQKVKDFCAAHGLDVDAMIAHTKKQKKKNKSTKQ
jgi:hypothetical protein